MYSYRKPHGYSPRRSRLREEAKSLPAALDLILPIFVRERTEPLRRERPLPVHAGLESVVVDRVEEVVVEVIDDLDGLERERLSVLSYHDALQGQYITISCNFMRNA